MENHTIYIITHIPTGLFYIGRTKQHLSVRFAEHILRAFSPSQKKSKIHFLLADKDINEFRIDVLETNIKSVDEAIRKEKYYIESYQACELGLNTYCSGSGYREINEVTKNNIGMNYMSGYSIDEICKHYSISSPTAVKIIKEKTGVNHVFYRGLIPAPYYIDPNQII